MCVRSVCNGNMEEVGNDEQVKYERRNDPTHRSKQHTLYIEFVFKRQNILD